MVRWGSPVQSRSSAPDETARKGSFALPRPGLRERGRENGSFPAEKSSESSSAENRVVFRKESSTTIPCRRLKIVLGVEIRYKFYYKAYLLQNIIQKKTMADFLSFSCKIVCSGY